MTATLQVDEQALPLSVTYGSALSVEALRQLLADHNIPEAGISWTPDITQPLYADTAFTAVRKTTDSGGAPTVPDADTPRFRQQGPRGHALRRSIRPGQQQLRHRSHARAVTEHPSMTHRRKEALPCTN